jgi:glutamate---cysteine ligase / carboxylate-amine ligase
MRPSPNCHAVRTYSLLSDELQFKPSPDVSVGVELELQLLDPASRELAPGAIRVLEACREEKLTGVANEFLLCMVEARTEVCRNVQEVSETFVPLLRKVRNISRSLGYEVTSAGTHPSGRPLMSAIYPDERYQRIQSKQGWMAYQEAVFGLHVHVGVPDADLAIQVTNLLSPYLPHLLALSSNSPLWEGLDTSYASARARMFRPAAHVGVPPQFPGWSDYSRFVAALHRSGAIESTKDLYWDIRPRGDFGTIEFRIFDAPSTAEHLLALVALTRCLVVHALRVLERNPRHGRPSFTRAWISNDNRWLASRYGLDAPSMRRSKGRSGTLRDDCRWLIHQLLPLAESLGERPFLEPFLKLPDFETGADRQRQVFRESGRWQQVVDDMCDRWTHGLEHVSFTSKARQPPSLRSPLASSRALSRPELHTPPVAPTAALNGKPR